MIFRQSRNFQIFNVKIRFKNIKNFRVYSDFPLLVGWDVQKLWGTGGILFSSFARVRSAYVLHCASKFLSTGFFFYFFQPAYNSHLFLEIVKQTQWYLKNRKILKPLRHEILPTEWLSTFQKALRSLKRPNQTVSQRK